MKKSPQCPHPHCGSSEVVRAGYVYYGRKRQRWLCKSCGRTFVMIFPRTKKRRLMRGY